MNMLRRYEHLFWQALRSPLGIVVSTDDTAKLAQCLGTARNEAKRHGIFDFNDLQIRQRPAGEIWLIKKVRRDAQNTAEPGQGDDSALPG